jgi:hydrogenase maturation protease
MRTLVLGLGNPLLRDDRVGLLVARELKDRLSEAAGIEVDEDYHGGLRLMERLVGYDRAVVVDAIQSGQPPGTIHRLQVDSRPTQRSASAHDVNLATALALGRQTGASLPPDEAIHLLAIEAKEVLDFGEELTPEVEQAIPRAVQLVLQILGIDKESA